MYHKLLILMEKVSILIAVYNSALFLEKCLDSVIAQTYSNLQIICIDDASTDESLSILHRYALDDARFSILHNSKNRGISHTRNRGLEIADGDFIMMLDSDDWLSSDAIAQAIDTFRQHPLTDTVIFDLILHYDDNTYCPYPNFSGKSVLSGAEAMRYTFNWEISGLYLSRTAICKESPYDDTSRFGADENTTRIHYFKSREVRFCSGKYFYRQHDKSVSHTKASFHYFGPLIADISMKRQLIALNPGKNIIDIFERTRWHNMIGMYKNLIEQRQNFAPYTRRRILVLFRNALLHFEPTRIPLTEQIRCGFLPMKNLTAFRLYVNAYCTIRNIIPQILLKKRLKI